MKTLYPLCFSPRFQDYLWGGRNLETVLGRTIPDGIVAESWEISAHPAAPTAVLNGPLEGTSLPDLLSQHGTALVGERGRWALERGTFPLLIKLLDANQPLSVQVHPDDAFAGEHEGGELGKTEAWHILHAAPGASIIAGVRAGVDRRAFESAVSAGNVEECLHRVPVSPGDTVLIPAGTVHAIMDGVLLAEVQQSSNTTYRVFDWNRVGPDGTPRDLHLDQALQVIDWARVEPGPEQPTVLEDSGGVRREQLTACDKFVIERLTFAEGAQFQTDLTGETFEIWGVTSGAMTVSAGRNPGAEENQTSAPTTLSNAGASDAAIGGEALWSDLGLSAVAFALLPASLGPVQLSAKTPTKALRVYLP